MSTILTEGAKETTGASEGPKDENKSQEAPKADAPNTNEAPKKEEQSKADAPKTEEKPKDEKPVVPEKYDLKLADGSLLDPSAIERIAKLAKERGLTNEQAQKELDRENESVKSYVEVQKATLKKQSEDWFKECKADRDFGGDKLKESAELAKRVMKWADPSGDLERFLDETGLGNHPAAFRAFAKLGRAFKDDKTVFAGEAPKAPKSLEDRLYGPKE